MNRNNKIDWFIKKYVRNGLLRKSISKYVLEYFNNNISDIEQDFVEYFIRKKVYKKVNFSNKGWVSYLDTIVYRFCIRYMKKSKFYNSIECLDMHDYGENKKEIELSAWIKNHLKNRDLREVRKYSYSRIYDFLYKGGTKKELAKILGISLQRVYYYVRDIKMDLDSNFLGVFE